ncbi:inositol monophosphatase family protein [Bacteroidota bacterium]
MSLEIIALQVCEAAKEAGQFLLKERKNFDQSKVEEKSFNQLVSYVDKTSEELLVEHLKKILPEAGFITEEKTIATDEKEWMWVIDPLDGTTNFVHALPVFSVSIGLIQQGVPKLGVVYEPNRDELFYAWIGGGAWMNGNRIHVKTNKELAKSLLATGFPYYDFHIMPMYLDTLNSLLKSTQGMRRMGSAAVDLAYTACGRFDGFFEYGLSPWDVAAGIVLIEEAGGVVRDFKGGKDMLFGRTILGSSSAIYPAFISIIQENFKKLN